MRKSSSAMTTPAACTEQWRVVPSSPSAILISRFTRGSSAISLGRRSSFFWASGSVMPSWSGTSFAMRSVSANVKPITRPTSRRTPFASIFPKVMIWVTRVLPP